jgi:hypothetical protein
MLELHRLAIGMPDHLLVGPPFTSRWKRHLLPQKRWLLPVIRGFTTKLRPV